jgi:solute carrier family 25 protein 16
MPSSTQSTQADLRHFLAGGLAGCSAKTLIAPFDRVKILFQTESPLVAGHAHKTFGVFPAIGQIYSKQGFISLYRGHSMTLARIFPYAAIQFASYERWKALMDKLDIPLRIKRFLSGSLAGVTAVTCTYPFDMLRTRLVYRGESLRQIVKAIGTERFSFFQGYSATFCGVFLYAGSSFGTFEWLKSVFFTENVGVKFLCGMVAGLTGQTISYPLETIRRRMQLRNAEQKLSAYRSILASAREIYSASRGIGGGLRGFYTGLSINFIKAGPSSGVAFVVYETLKKKME